MNITLHPWVGQLRRRGVGAAVCTLLCGGGLLPAACGQLQTAADGTATAAAGGTATATASAVGTPIASGTGAPVGTPTLRPLPPKPTPELRTPISSVPSPGVFADGRTGLPPVDSSSWKAYSDEAYGFSFSYPPDWSLFVSPVNHDHGPNGEPAYPLFSVQLENPVSEQGAKVPGVTCAADGNDCHGAPPGYLDFRVELWPEPCGVAGLLIASDSADVAGKTAERCVVEYPNDKSRTAVFAFARADGTYLKVILDRGNDVSAANQAALETILSTFRIK